MNPPLPPDMASILREQNAATLADLRAAGVKSCHFDHEGNVAMVEFFPASPPSPAAAEDRPLPKQRTADEKLFNPLGIIDGPPRAKAGGG